MILYYTGTGNSRHLARILAEKLEDELVSAAETSSSSNFSARIRARWRLLPVPV